MIINLKTASEDKETLNISTEELKERIGNKAFSLLEMSKIDGVNIPNGIILDTDEYDTIIIENKLKRKIQSALSELNKDNISLVSTEIAELLNTIDTNNYILSCVVSKLNIDKQYAIRSSATKEDLEYASFAGQYDTFLNIQFQDIPEKIVKCYKSLFSKESLSYILDNNIDTTNLKMAIIIQEMVEPDYSGVCFTLNPITGNDTELIIELSTGLGENLVSGKTKPQKYIYNWYNNKEIRNTTTLDKNILSKCVATFTQIQQHYGYPCDIEFAIKNETLYILQSRMITSIKYENIKDVWTTAVFRDNGVSASACKQLMWSLYEWIFDEAMRNFIANIGLLKHSEMSKITQMYYGRGYWDISTIKKALNKIPTFSEEELNDEYGIGNIEGYITQKISPNNIAQALKTLIKANNISNTRFKELDYRRDIYLDKYMKYTNNQYTKNIEHQWKKLIKDYHDVETYYYQQIYINTVYQALYKKILFNYISKSEYLTLLNNLENISHMRPLYDMWQLSREIKANKQSLKYWLESDSKEIEKDLNNLNRNYHLAKLQILINNYGYHSDKELDISYPNYVEEKYKIINSIQRMITLSDESSPKQVATQSKERYNKVLHSLKNKLSPLEYKLVTNIIKQMREMIWWREELKDISTRFYHLIRIYTLSLANKFIEQNIIESQEDIWYIKVKTLLKYLNNHKTTEELRLSIAKNKFYYNSYRNFLSENEVGEIYKSDKVNIIENNKTTIKGVVANSGTVSGRARILHNISEINKLTPGDILVTKYTDTGWTPQFNIIKGIITEYGGILCHTATVAREYNIPAIVCCKNINKIKDGTHITINGETGEVIING